MSVAESRDLIQTALNQRSQDEISGDVKRAVADQVTRLNPEAKITFTAYFNHIAMPDMVVKWPSHERPVFLRYALDDASLVGDMETLSRQEPIVMAVTGERNPPSGTIHERLDHSVETLTTHIESIAYINENEVTSPVGELLRESLLTSGHGLLDENTTEKVVAVGSNEPLLATELLDELVAEILSPEASRQIQRAQRIIAWAAGGEPIEATAGNLTAAEIRSLLPHILELDAAQDNESFWAYLGGLISFNDLLNLGPRIDGQDVTPLVKWGSAAWRVRAAQISERLLVEGEEDLRNWVISGRKIKGQGKNEQIFLTDDTRRLSPRTNTTSPPDWKWLSSRLADLPVNSVELTGLTRNLSISGPDDRTDGVLEDAIQLTESLEESFGTTRVILIGSPDNSKYTLDMKLNESVATAYPHAPLRDVVRHAFSVLGSASSDADLPSMDGAADEPSELAAVEEVDQHANPTTDV